MQADFPSISQRKVHVPRRLPCILDCSSEIVCTDKVIEFDQFRQYSFVTVQKIKEIGVGLILLSCWDLLMLTIFEETYVVSVNVVVTWDKVNLTRFHNLTYLAKYLGGFLVILLLT
jgi:hypothetical protein